MQKKVKTEITLTHLIRSPKASYWEIRFADRIFAKVGVRRTQAQRERPLGKAKTEDSMKEQTGFGF